jgi:hypothetical protein
MGGHGTTPLAGGGAVTHRPIVHPHKVGAMGGLPLHGSKKRGVTLAEACIQMSCIQLVFTYIQLVFTYIQLAFTYIQLTLGLDSFRCLACIRPLCALPCCNQFDFSPCGPIDCI